MDTDTAGPATSSRKPGMLEAAAILTLISGIVHVLGFLGFLVWCVLTLGIACFLLPLAVLPLALGIFEIRYALDLLASPIRRDEPSRALAIIQICLIVVGNVIALTTGIVALVAYSDEDVVRHFAEARRSRGTG